MISLDSAVVLPETETAANGHPFRFKIRHVKKSVHPEARVQRDRVFSCPKDLCEAWVLSINQALLKYEKDKAGSRRSSSLPLMALARSESLAPRDVSPTPPRRCTQLLLPPPRYPSTLALPP